MDYTQKPWGFEAVWADTDLYSAHMIIIKENEQTPYMYHKRRDKTIFVLQGIVALVEEGKTRTLGEGEKYHISPKIMHRLIALKTDATILEVGTKIEDDIVIVEE